VRRGTISSTERNRCLCQGERVSKLHARIGPLQRPIRSGGIWAFCLLRRHEAAPHQHVLPINASPKSLSEDGPRRTVVVNGPERRIRVSHRPAGVGPHIYRPRALHAILQTRSFKSILL
jgi:hypothetical protein